MSGPSGNDAGGMKRTLSIWNFFATGFGAIVGAGWVLLVGDWMVIGDGSIAATIASTTGVALLLPMGAVFGELTAVVPISGGIIEHVDRTHGRNISYITGWSLALGNGILCPWEAIAISTLVSGMLEGLSPVLRAVKPYTIMGTDVCLFPIVIASGFAVYVILLNLQGVSAATRLQTLLAKTLLAGIFLAVVASFVKGGPPNILSSSAQVEGPSAVTNADNMFTDITLVLVMTPFFYAGFNTISRQAEEAAEDLDWNKFDKVISMALLAADGPYMIYIYSFGTIISWTDLIKNTVPALACLKNINMSLYVAMLIIVTSDPMGPMNSFYGATSRIALVIGRKEQFPDSFTVLDEESGASKTASTVPTVLTIMGPFLGENMLVSLTNVSALTFIFSCAMVSFACLKIRCTRSDPPRPYKVPGGKAGICTARLAGTIIIGFMVVPFSPATFRPVEWTIVVARLVIGLGLSTVTKAKVNNRVAAAAK